MSGHRTQTRRQHRRRYRPRLHQHRGVGGTRVNHRRDLGGRRRRRLSGHGARPVQVALQRGLGVHVGDLREDLVHSLIERPGVTDSGDVTVCTGHRGAGGPGQRAEGVQQLLPLAVGQPVDERIRLPAVAIDVCGDEKRGQRCRCVWGGHGIEGARWAGQPCAEDIPGLEDKRSLWSPQCCPAVPQALLSKPCPTRPDARPSGASPQTQRRQTTAPRPSGLPADQPRTHHAAAPQRTASGVRGTIPRTRGRPCSGPMVYSSGPSHAGPTQPPATARRGIPVPNVRAANSLLGRSPSQPWPPRLVRANSTPDRREHRSESPACAEPTCSGGVSYTR
ncbi:UNVERIFIED_ORG: hypothetical protein CLV66_12470 [Actinomadura viridilutea]